MKLRHLALLMLFIFSCSKENANVTSKELTSAKERVKTLKKFVPLKSPIEDCHFELSNVNLKTDRSIPNSSDHTYELALKVAPEHFEAWTKNLTHTSFPLNTGWYDSLIAKQDGFSYTTPTFMSKDGGTIVIGYEREALLFIRIRQY